MNKKLSHILGLASGLAIVLSFGGITSGEAWSAVTSGTAGSFQSSDMSAADQQVETSKEKLSLAKKQVEAARAHLRASEAEFKAATASREALSLRTKAQSLADATGFTSNTPAKTANDMKSLDQATTTSQGTNSSVKPGLSKASMDYIRGAQNGNIQQPATQPVERLDFNAPSDNRAQGGSGQNQIVEPPSVQ